jgi:hypothetical protein
LDAFAHDLFPDERSFQAFSFVKRPVLAKLEQKVHNVSGRSWNYPCLIQASIAQGTSRAAVQEQQAQANDIANFDGEEFTLGYFPPGYKGGFEISEFDMALTEASGGVPDGAYMENFAVKMKEQPKEFGQRQERYFLGRSGRLGGGFGGGLLALEPVDLADQHENDEGQQDKIDRHREKASVGQHRHARFAQGVQGGAGAGRDRTQGDEQVGKVEPTDQCRHHGHDQIADHGINNLAKRTANDHPHGQIDHIAPDGKGLEFLQHAAPLMSY